MPFNPRSLIPTFKREPSLSLSLSRFESVSCRVEGPLLTKERRSWGGLKFEKEPVSGKSTFAERERLTFEKSRLLQERERECVWCRRSSRATLRRVTASRMPAPPARARFRDSQEREKEREREREREVGNVCFETGCVRVRSARCRGCGDCAQTRARAAKGGGGGGDSRVLSAPLSLFRVFALGRFGELLRAQVSKRRKSVSQVPLRKRQERERDNPTQLFGE